MYPAIVSDFPTGRFTKVRGDLACRELVKRSLSRNEVLLVNDSGRLPVHYKVGGLEVFITSPPAAPLRRCAAVVPYAGNVVWIIAAIRKSHPESAVRLCQMGP